jgi:MFS family permease
MATTSAQYGATTSDSPGLNEKLLFWASFFTLIAAGIGFSVRGFVLKDWGNQFGFTQAELGGISGGGLIGFGIAIIFFSFFADLFGYGKIMIAAFLLHLSSAVVTFAATPVYDYFGKDAAFICLNVGMWLFAFGNGTCEAVINPLTATLFPRNKTHWLNILHAGWPLGLILGAVIGLVFKQIDAPIRWEVKLGIFLVPVLMYGLMMFNRPFPRSEAQSAGVSVPNMMGTVGLLGFAVAAAFLGLALPKLLGDLGIKNVSPYVGYIAAGVIWVAYTAYSKFALGSLLIAFIYVLHALVGYVELGTDSWITNITERVLKDETTALLAFIWTNALMFTLRFFAGPIVHKINPIGLLLVSALLGTLGLYLLGQPFTNTIWLWIGAVTIYALGKTFYWPTLLGVISERFPKGGSLALGISGGIGMLSAGMLGGPGIGYKQDYAAVENLRSKSEDTYQRYASRYDEGEKKGELKPDGFPIVSSINAEIAPKIAGLDNSKLKVMDDYKGVVNKLESAKKDGKEPPKDAKTTLEADLETLQKEKAAGKVVGEKLEKNLTELKKWWDEQGLANFEKDKTALDEARDTGARKALYWTAAVPAALAIGFLLLLLYFMLTGGYKQVHIGGRH